MNNNLLAFEIKPYGQHARHDTCMLYKQNEKLKSDRKNKYIPDIILIGSFLIGLTIGLSHHAEIQPVQEVSHAEVIIKKENS